MVVPFFLIGCRTWIFWGHTCLSRNIPRLRRKTFQTRESLNSNVTHFSLIYWSINRDFVCVWPAEFLTLMVVRHFEYMELYIKKRVSAADFLGIFREYSEFPHALVSFLCCFHFFWKLWLNQSNEHIYPVWFLLDVGIVWEDVVLMDEVLPEAALSDLSAEVDPHLCCVVLFFVIMCRTIYDY